MKRTSFQPYPEPGAVLCAGEPRLDAAPGGGSRYSFPVWLQRPGGRDFFLQDVGFTVSAPVTLPTGAGNPALSAALLPAMALGVPLRVDAPVSPRLLEGLERYQEVMHAWFPEEFRPIEVRAPAAPVPETVLPVPMPADRAGMFFSGGVDAFDLLRHRVGEVSSLIYIHGFDIGPEYLAQRAAIEAHVAGIAADEQRELILVQTDARRFSDAYAWWGRYSGSLLGAAAQLLEGRLNRVYIAASTTYRTLVPDGTSSLTDDLFSTEGLDLRHDGAARSRCDKVFNIAQWPYALERLRVCWGLEGGLANCCRCDKCLRTMTTLWMAGALERATTFPEPLSAERIATFPLKLDHADFIRENLERGRELGLADTPVMRAWERALAGAELRAAPPDAGALAALLDSFPLLPHWASRHREALLLDLARHAPDRLYREIFGRHPALRGTVLAHLLRYRPGVFFRTLFRRLRHGPSGSE